MNLDFEKLLAEHEFAQILERVKNFDVFEFVRFDKANKIELRIGTRHCDNGIWQDNFMCFVDGSKKYGDYHGFGYPFQRAEFLKKSYGDVVKMYACFGYSTKAVKQIDMFSFLALAKVEQKGVY